MKLALIASLAVAAATANAQFGGFFDHIFRQQHQQQQQQNVHEDSNAVENSYDERDCDGYLCADTLVCVQKPIDCPCPFTGSQLKCVLPDKKSYVCISKPTGDEHEDVRDCSFVNKAWNGEL